MRAKPGGTFQPLPPIHDGTGNEIDPASAASDPAPGFYTGEPVAVAITDANRNTDTTVREFVDVEIETSTGDAETLRLQETGNDTGVFAGAIQSVEAPPAATQYDCVLSLAAFAEINARYTDSDFPLDALSVAAASYAPLDIERVMRLEQRVSKQVAEVGDFLQYTLVLENIHSAPVFDVRIIDTLPQGVRYQAGSLRVGSTASPGAAGIAPAATALVAPGADGGLAPTIDESGLRVEFPVGDLPPGASVTATFIAEVGSGASGPELVNRAVARADRGLSSNDTDTVVRMRDLLMTSRFTIVGSVTEGRCDAPAPGAVAALAGFVLDDLEEDAGKS